MTQRSLSFHHLEALRGILAVYVLIGHARWLLWEGHTAWMTTPHEAWEAVPAYLSAVFRYGREAVMVFFVLSGFFIHYQAAALAPSRDFSAKRFYQRRWHRLAPPFFFALAVTVICDVIGRTWWPTLYEARTGDALLDGTFARTGFSMEAVVPALLLLPSSLGRDFGSNGPLWSIAYEVVYYAIYPAWLLLRRRNREAAFLLVPIACLALVFVPVSGFPLAVAAHYPIWLAGAFLAEWVRRHRIEPRLVTVAGVLFTSGAILRIATTLPIAGLVAALLYGTGAVVLFGACRDRNTLSRIGEFLGLRSYTIYVVHFPMLALISAWAIQIDGQRPMHGWLAAGGAIATIALACGCFELCERHFLHSRYRDESAAL